MINGQICIKIKSNDIIKFLIGQFDLIMDQIELIWVQIKDLVKCKDLTIL
jgi:hypothetical protein